MLIIIVKLLTPLCFTSNLETCSFYTGNFDRRLCANGTRSVCCTPSPVLSGRWSTMGWSAVRCPGGGRDVRNGASRWLWSNSLVTRNEIGKWEGAGAVWWHFVHWLNPRRGGLIARRFRGREECPKLSAIQLWPLMASWLLVYLERRE